MIKIKQKEWRNNKNETFFVFLLENFILISENNLRSSLQQLLKALKSRKQRRRRK